MYYFLVLLGGVIIGLIFGGHPYFDTGRSKQLKFLHSKIDSLILKLNTIMANQAQLAQELRDLKAQTEKAKAEIIAKVAALEAAIGDAGNTTAEVDEALADLKASVQGVDDLNPDAPPEEETPTP